MSGLEVEFSVDGRESETQDDEGANETETGESQTQSSIAAARPTRIQGRPPPRERRSSLLRLRAVPIQLMQLLGHAGLHRMVASHNDGGGGITLQIDDGRARSTKNHFPAVPSEIGQKLMDGGVFGTSEYYRDSLRRKNKNLARKLMSRELGNDRNHSTRENSAISQV